MAQSVSEILAVLRGRLVVFDGPDGVGKTTIARRFAHLLESCDIPVCAAREPGATRYGERIRALLLGDGGDETLCPRAEMLLFIAARAQLADRIIVPALARGETVVLDRYLASTLAYQGAAGVRQDHILAIHEAILPGNAWPFCTFILDAPPAVAQARAKAVPDRIEKRTPEYRLEVRRNYLEIAGRFKRMILVDSSGAEDQTMDAVIAGFARALPGLL